MRTTFPPRSMTLLIVGIACTMRRSSVIFSPSSGTLKSTRMSTRFPFTSMSATVFFAMMNSELRLRARMLGDLTWGFNCREIPSWTRCWTS
jgi:hypothetical protein